MSIRARAIWVLAAVLFSAPAVADEPLPEWFARSAIPTHWQWAPDSYPIEAASPYRLTPAVAYEDANLLLRYRDVRSLSLLTLAEFGRTSLFFGVNEHGMFGLHFRADRPLAASDLLSGL